MIVCPRCSYENEDSAMNCASCRINLQWALENRDEAVQHNLERMEGPPPEAQAGARVLRGFLVIVLLMAIPASGLMALWSFVEGVLSAGNGGDLAAAGFWLLVAVVCIPAATVVLLRRQPIPNLVPGLRILALIGVTAGLLFGLMRLTLVIIPEHTERSLIIQYKLGERDFRGANLEQAELSEADLHEANLSGADLREADLTGANLFEANLREADLSGADLTEAQLYGVNLSSADLREADLTRANLFRIILRGADLRGAAVTSAQLDSARNLEGAILPDGSVHE